MRWCAPIRWAAGGGIQASSVCSPFTPRFFTATLPPRTTIGPADPCSGIALQLCNTAGVESRLGRYLTLSHQREFSKGWPAVTVSPIRGVSS
jgi:hypothetical protein